MSFVVYQREIDPDKSIRAIHGPFDTFVEANNFSSEKFNHPDNKIAYAYTSYIFYKDEFEVLELTHPKEP